MVSFDPIIAHIRLRIQPVSESVPRRPPLETGCATSVPGAFSGEKAVENQRPFSGPSSPGRAGLVDLRWHDLRHEAICRLFEAGYEIQEVALVSGHRDWNMLRRYTHLKPESLHREPYIKVKKAPWEDGAE